MASNHGHLFSIQSDNRKDFIEQGSELLMGQRAQAIWSDLGVELAVLFEHFPQWESSESLNNLKKIIKRYYTSYDIYISDIETGLYYNIPVKFRDS